MPRRRRHRLAAGLAVAVIAIGSIYAASRRSDDGRSGKDLARSAISATRCLVSKVSGDFDGDGRPDRALVFAGISGPQRRCQELWQAPRQLRPHWWLAAIFGNHRHVARHLDTEPTGYSDSPMACADYCELVAAPDLNGDGRSELEVAFQHGAATAIVGFFRFDGTSFRRIPGSPPTNESDDPKSFVLTEGASLNYASSIRCRTRGGKRLVAQIQIGRGWPGDKAEIDTSEHDYRYDRTSLRLVSKHSTKVVESRATEEREGDPLDPRLFKCTLPAVER